jgi:hypothetical protein
MTPQEICQRYLWAGAMTRNADALAGLFAADGVLEAPLVPAGGDYPRRVEGREQIRAAMAPYYQRSANPGQTVDAGRGPAGWRLTGLFAARAGKAILVRPGTDA